MGFPSFVRLILPEMFSFRSQKVRGLLHPFPQEEYALLMADFKHNYKLKKLITLPNIKYHVHLFWVFRIVPPKRPHKPARLHVVITPKLCP
jgi:hypothetical protein